MASLLACPACNCHFRVGEPECPHCGAAIAREARTLGRTAGSIALGLVAIASPLGCGHPSSGTGGAGSTSQVSTAVVSQAASTYGCGPTCSGGPATSGTGCDAIGVCADPMAMGDPTKDCADCALTQGNQFSDEGACI